MQLCGVRTHSQWRRTRTCARLATVPSEPARPTGELLHLLVARGGCCREVGWRTAEHAEAEEKVEGAQSEHEASELGVQGEVT